MHKLMFAIMLSLFFLAHAVATIVLPSWESGNEADLNNLKGRFLATNASSVNFAWIDSVGVMRSRAASAVETSKLLDTILNNTRIAKQEVGKLSHGNRLPMVIFTWQDDANTAIILKTSQTERVFVSTFSNGEHNKRILSFENSELRGLLQRLIDVNVLNP